MADAKSIKGTQTEKNLVAAYTTESSAYSRYLFYAQQAKKESYFPVQEIFEATAANEMHHAKVFFKFLQGGQVQIPVTVDAGVIGTTSDNLATAIHEEEEEGVVMYTNAADVAEKEGFPEIAEHFRAIATIESKHRDRFAKFKEMVDNGTLWKRDTPVTWRCLVCGYEYVGTEPPTKCPACDHPYQHYIAVDDACLGFEAV